MKTVIVTLTAPSGTGKSHLEDHLVAKHGFVKLVSHTTRSPRPGEVNGKDYHYTTLENWPRHGPWVEDITFGENKYGMAERTLTAAAATKKPLVVVVEPHGMQAFSDYAANHEEVIHLAIFLSISERERIKRFLLRAAAELQQKGEAALDPLATRLTSIIGKERQWTRDAQDGTALYHGVYSYTPASAGLVSTSIVKMVKSAIEFGHAPEHVNSKILTL